MMPARFLASRFDALGYFYRKLNTKKTYFASCYDGEQSLNMIVFIIFPNVNAFF